MAKREGVSLNQYLVSTLAESVGMKECLKTRPRKRATAK
jgi:hypothetical protein